jgi:tyrosyl-tRNA synthetase
MEGAGTNPMALKKRLAQEIITKLYDVPTAEAAAEYFARTVQRKEVPEEIAECRLITGQTLPQVIVEAQLAKSLSEARRLIAAGAVELDGATVSSATCTLSPGSILRVGKRRFVRLIG